jgi:LysR family transcriptional activator of nhaA
MELPRMRRFNYRHLWYFWHVAREGGMTAASHVLDVSQPALSSQVRKLENSLGEELFDRTGRGLELTEVGRVVFGYAEEIFALGRELSDAVDGLPGRGPLRLSVGIVEAFPKLLAHHLVAPARAAFEHLRLVVETAHPERLFARLAVHDLDLVISDAPLPTTLDIQAYNHPLGESGVTLLAAPELAARYGAGFPGSLDGAPFIMPGDHSSLRRQLRQWLVEQKLEPRVVAEVEDTAILKVFGQEGLGIFAIATAEAEEVARRYHVEPLGELPGVVERFYGISVERRIRNPAVAVIAEAARTILPLSWTGREETPSAAGEPTS